MKVCPRLDRALEDLDRLDIIDRIVPTTPMHPDDLFELRRGCHVSVDEIITGGFHQVSLEGLATGNAVVNGADFFSKAVLAEAAGAAEMPPFVHAEPDSVEDVLLKLARTPDWLREIQAASSRYFAAHLSPEALAARFCRLYEEVAAL
jgi:glycosyltransferase involved in cell wall biosynthesis